MQVPQQGTKYPNLRDIALPDIALKLNIDGEPTYQSGLSLTNPESLPVRKAAVFPTEQAFNAASLRSRIVEVESIITSLLHPIKKFSIAQFRPKIAEVMHGLSSGSVEIENQKREQVATAVLSPKQELLQAQQSLHLLVVDLSKSDAVYTFETHPFYSKIRDYNDAEMPDEFSASGEVIK